MKRTYPLHFHLSTILLFVVLFVGSVIAWVGYRFSYDMLEASTTDLTERISERVANEIEHILVPADMSVDFLIHGPLSVATSLQERWQRLAAIRAMLKRSDDFSAIYIAYESGDMFMMRPVRDEATRLELDAPAGTQYFIKSIERASGKAIGKYLFLDEELRILREDSRPEYARKYDPRERPWYKQAMATSGLVTTAPYLFYSDRKVGVTIAKHTPNGKAVVGVDLLLETVEKTLAQQKITPSSQIAVVNADGYVLAHAEAARLMREDSESAAEPRLKLLDELGIPAFSGLSAVVKANARGGTNNSQLQVAGQDWRLVLREISIEGTDPVYLVLVIPYRELFAEAFKLRDTSMLITLIIILIAVPITWMLARTTSSSLRQLAQEAESIRHFDFSTPIVVRSAITEVHDFAEIMDGMKTTIQRFLDVTRAVAVEENFERLLPMLVKEALSMADAQAAVLYLADAEKLSPAIALDTQGRDVSAGLKRLNIADKLPLLSAAIQKQKAMSGDLSAAEIEAMGIELLIAKSYAAHSVVMPLLNRQHQLVGVLLLQRNTVIDEAQLAFVSAVSDFASSSLETRELIQAQKDLFEAFIRIIAGAIDAKSPYTGGHCARVPELTKMLAQAACNQTSGVFKDFSLDEGGWETVHVASWLHDCGKVTTPDFVVDKATKLETIYDRIHEVRMRFEVLKRDAEIACLKAIAAGEPTASARQRLVDECKQLDAEFAFLAECNEGGESMAPEKIQRLQMIAQRTWMRTLDDRLGVSHEEKERKAHTPAAALPAVEPVLADKPEHCFMRGDKDTINPNNPWGFQMKVPELLYNRGELHNLSIMRGTLAAEDRYKINEHIVHTIMMLSQLPFPKHLRQVPEIAGGHHEKMDGSGYPKRLSKEQMSPVARMMAVADIFEALTAVDRPYKKGKTLSEAIRIMSFMKKDQHIDPDIFDLFLRSGIYMEYAKRYMRPELIDEVDITQYLSPPHDSVV